ncbi:hypothetical protein AMIS_22940 [Actinoplanes missouriensis 431]|uniref:DUF1648 domain-containing protein n=1 Tax=Actinoplanes missouriensis (strain ATCC 14538 / DSM 43046 / CBS 188.64 / JCM 3121 / NBRC 102363 / NCIMB 12654 / NRRL B-3342 / UNCC 431) TaxID=512565 RepID=I0H3C7_ACTM4|nr:DUF1648 domain-containing protein [Actinoplanes missouriensis]BAL87514.1 hypothetical protein AMIS_22940 [Actinoplanes missouriensis 431]
MRRLQAAAAVIWLPVVVTAVTGIWRDELPARIATHWSGSGPADGFSSTTGFWTTMLIIGVLAGVAGLIAAAMAATATRHASQPAQGGDPAQNAGSGGNPGSAGVAGQDGDPARDVRRIAVGRGLLVGAGAVAGGSAGVWVSTATATLADPVDPRLGWRFAYLFLGMAWALVVWLILGKAPRIDVPAEPPVDALLLAPTERAAFSTTLRSPLLIGSTLLAAAALTAGAVLGAPGLWFVVPVPLVLAFALGRVRVTADRRGLRVVTGVGVTVKHVALADIVSAEAAEINPMEWGGWGYRVMPGRSALVLRGGPGLVVNLHDGRRFAVTLDDPRTPAALLNGLHAKAAD